MDLKQVNQVFDHKITEGSDYQWNCFPNARFLDYESDYAHASVLFNVTNQQIYCAEVHDKNEKYQYRYIDPTYVEAYRTEAKARNVDPNQAWDEVKWTDLETEEDFLEKAKAVFNDKEFDTRIVVPLDWSDEEQFNMMKLAHERDMSLNKFVEYILTEFIENSKRNESQ